MLRVIYNQPDKRTIIMIFWTLFIFLSVNFFFFMLFINLCFQGQLKINSQLPLVLIICLGLDWISGTYQSLNIIWWILDGMVIIGLCLSWLLNSYAQFQIIIIIRLSQIYFMNEMLFDLAKTKTKLFKIFIMLRIIYWIALLSHVAGCIFYYIDNKLIQQQYYGSILTHPQLYYQTNMLAYTPIYTLTPAQKYIYAMYFTTSLFSTVAFGDVVPKNPIENGYVIFLIILATIGIALIIQQMYGFFRSEKQLYQSLISNIKYVSQYLKTEPSITKQYRYKIINYMIYSQQQQYGKQPNFDKLTKSLSKQVLQNSLIFNCELNTFIKKYMLHLFTSVKYPSGYIMVDHSHIYNLPIINIIFNGTYKLGYTKQGFGNREYFAKNNPIFGLKQMLIGNNTIEKDLYIRVISQCNVYKLDYYKFRSELQKIKQRQHSKLSSHPIQYYQLAKNQAIFKKENNYCFYCKENVQHNVLNCPTCHFVPQLRDIIKRNKERIYLFKRRTNKSNKIRNTDQIKYQLYPFIEQNNRDYINKIKIKLKNKLDQMIDRNCQKNNNFGYYSWNIYCPQGSLQ